MDTLNWIMDTLNWIMDTLNWIMDTTICKNTHRIHIKNTSPTRNASLKVGILVGSIHKTNIVLRQQQLFNT